jgi:hypothetical protein
VRADPEPDEIVAVLYREGAIVEADAHGPEPTDALEMKRGMTGV